MILRAVKVAVSVTALMVGCMSASATADARQPPRIAVHAALIRPAGDADLGNPEPVPSCPTTHWCATVDPERGGAVFRIVQDGRWRTVHAPAPDDASDQADALWGALTNVSCSQPHDCVFAAEYLRRRDNAEVWAILTFDHGKWAGAPVLEDHSRARMTGAILDLSCGAPTFCLASGESGRQGPFVLTLRDKKLTTTTTGLSLSAVVDCATPHWCAGFLAPDFIIDHDGALTDLKLRNPGHGSRRSSLPGSIDCLAAGRCVALGEYSAHGSDTGLRPYLSTLVKRRVTTSFAPKQIRTDWQTQVQVSCSSLHQCAVASAAFYQKAHGQHYSRPAVVTHRDGRWRTHLLSVPASAKRRYAMLNDVSCVPSGYCVAVGYAATSEWGGRALVAIHENGHWTDRVAPSPAVPGQPKHHTFYDYRTVTCAGRASCLTQGVAKYSQLQGVGYDGIVANRS